MAYIIFSPVFGHCSELFSNSTGIVFLTYFWGRMFVLSASKINPGLLTNFYVNKFD